MVLVRLFGLAAFVVFYRNRNRNQRPFFIRIFHPDTSTVQFRPSCKCVINQPDVKCLVLPFNGINSSSSALGSPSCSSGLALLPLAEGPVLGSPSSGLAHSGLRRTGHGSLYAEGPSTYVCALSTGLVHVLLDEPCIGDESFLRCKCGFHFMI